MKKLIYSLILASSVLYIGCQKEEERNPLAAAEEAARAAEEAARAAEEAARVPTSDEYRVLLERRKDSVDGANIDIRQEVRRYERATDEEKRELYNKVEALVK